MSTKKNELLIEPETCSKLSPTSRPSLAVELVPLRVISYDLKDRQDLIELLPQNRYITYFYPPIQ
jgi:hypothetical protein